MELSRRSMLTVIGAGTAVALTGCGAGSTTAGSADGPAEGEITLLTPIYEGSDGKKLLEQEILGGFRKKHPRVKVNVDYTTYTQLNEKITTGLAGGLLPDVMMMGVGWIPRSPPRRRSPRSRRSWPPRTTTRSGSWSRPATTASCTPCRSSSTPGSSSSARTTSRRPESGRLRPTGRNSARWRSS